MPHDRSILFVCTANVTRSPAAAALFQNLANKTGESWDVASAGVRAIKGMLPNNIIKFVMKNRKISIDHHKSQPVTKKLVSNYRWIMVMESSHRDFIIKLDPTFASKTFCLRTFEVSSPLIPTDFPDPTGKNLNEYDELFSLLDQEIPRVYALLRERVTNYEMGPETE